MTGNSTTPLLLAVIAGAANVLGAIAITSRRNWSTRALEMMIAFSGGFMIAVTLVDIMPEALNQSGPNAVWIMLLGYLLVHLTQHTIAPHFHFGEETHQVTHAVSLSALIGLMLHMFVDGVAIASSFDVGGKLGILVFLAIVLHKLPEGFAISSLFLAAGSSRGRALAAAAALGVATIAGAAFIEVAASLSRYGLAISGGVTLYVAASNLVPEVQHNRGWRMPASFFAGCALYYLTRQLLVM